MRGAGEDGGAVGPWRRSGTEVLLELSDLLKRVRCICGCWRLGDLCSAKEVETFDNLFSEHLSCNLTWGLEMLLDQYCPNYVGYQQQTGSRDFNCQFFPQKF